MADRQILPDAALQRQSDGAAIGRDIGQTRRAIVQRRAPERLAGDGHAPAHRHPQPCDALDEFVLSVPLYAGEPDDFAGAQGQRQVVDGGFAAIAQGRQTLDLKRRRRDTAPRVLATRSRTGRPTIRRAISAQSRPRCRWATTRPAHHGDVVSGVENLSQFVRDEDDGMTAVGEPSHRDEQFVRLLRRQHGGRSSRIRRRAGRAPSVFPHVV